MNALDVGVAVHEGERVGPDSFEGVPHNAIVAVASGETLLDDGHLAIPDHIHRYLEVRVTRCSVAAVRAEGNLAGHVRGVLEALVVEEIEDRLVVSESRAREPLGMPVPIAELLECGAEESLEPVVSKVIEAVLPGRVIGAPVKPEFMSLPVQQVQRRAVSSAQARVEEHRSEGAAPAQLAGGRQLVRLRRICSSDSPPFVPPPAPQHARRRMPPTETPSHVHEEGEPDAVTVAQAQEVGDPPLKANDRVDIETEGECSAPVR